MKRIAIIPGDGIGIEVTREAAQVLETVRDRFGVKMELVQFDWGAEKYLRENVTLPEGSLEMFRRDFDAIFTGAFGDPRVESNRHAIDILAGSPSGLVVYSNLRPVRLLDACLSGLRRSGSANGTGNRSGLRGGRGDARSRRATLNRRGRRGHPSSIDAQLILQREMYRRRVQPAELSVTRTIKRNQKRRQKSLIFTTV